MTEKHHSDIFNIFPGCSNRHFQTISHVKVSFQCQSVTNLLCFFVSSNYNPLILFKYNHMPKVLNNYPIIGSIRKATNRPYLNPRGVAIGIRSRGLFERGAGPPTTIIELPVLPMLTLFLSMQNGIGRFGFNQFYTNWLRFYSFVSRLF